jgi:hypothetical protein
VVRRSRVKVRQDDRGELRHEGEALRTVARLGDGEQPGRSSVLADHDGQRRVRLASQGERDDHQRVRAQVRMADSGRPLRHLALGRYRAGQGG